MTGIDPAAEKRANPFVGPRPLEKGQRIFGRDREIDQLYYLLSAERVVLFHSPSGAGKSSLLQAGLVPRLTQQFDVWIPARVNLERNSNGREGVNRYVRSCNLGFEAEVPKLLQRDEETISTMTLVEYVDGRPRRRSARKNVVLIVGVGRQTGVLRTAGQAAAGAAHLGDFCDPRRLSCTARSVC
jgi:hypothetical protein